MFEEAFKQQPQNEEYGAQTFMANVRAANWKSAQQVRHSRYVRRALILTSNTRLPPAFPRTFRTTDMSTGA
jgi:hypothetical protein